MKIRNFGLGIIALLSFLPIHVFAALEPSLSGHPGQTPVLKSIFSDFDPFNSPDALKYYTGPGTCSNQYEPGRVAVQLSNADETVVPGGTQVFFVTIKNDTDTPIADGSLYINVSGIKKPSAAKVAVRSTAPSVPEITVAQFKAIDHMKVAAHAAYHEQFRWKVPEKIPAGIYSASSKFLEVGKLDYSSYNRQTEGVSVVSFRIDSQTADPEISIIPPMSEENLFSSTSSPTVPIEIRNNSKDEKNVHVTLDLYPRDQLSGKPLSRLEKIFTLKSGESETLPFTLNDHLHSKYVLVASVKLSGNETYIKNIILLRNAKELPYILMTGKSISTSTSKSFVCFGGLADYFNSSKNPSDMHVQVSFLGQNGEIKNISDTRLSATSSVVAGAIISSSVTGFDMLVDLLRGKDKIDSVILPYSGCVLGTEKECKKGDVRRNDLSIIFITICTLLVVAIVFIIWRYYRRDRQNKGRHGKINIFLLLLVCSPFVLLPKISLASDPPGYWQSGGPSNFPAMTSFGDLQVTESDAICNSGNIPNCVRDIKTYNMILQAKAGTEYWVGGWDGTNNTDITSCPSGVSYTVPVGTVLYYYIERAANREGTTNDMPFSSNGTPYDSGYGAWGNLNAERQAFYSHSNGNPVSNTPYWASGAFGGQDIYETGLRGLGANACGSADVAARGSSYKERNNVGANAAGSRYIDRSIVLPGYSFDSSSMGSAFSCVPYDVSGNYYYDYTYHYMKCTAIATGTVIPTFNVGSALARFTGSTYDQSTDATVSYSGAPECNGFFPCVTRITPHCYPDGVAFTAATGNVTSGGVSALSIPARTKTVCPIVIVPANVAPNAPTVTKLYTGDSTGKSFLFSFSGTDPDNDGVYYEVAWQWASNPTYISQVQETYYYSDPSDSTSYHQPGYVNDSTIYTASGGTMKMDYTYYSPEIAHVIKVRTVDSHGLRSAWTTYTFDIMAPPSPPTNFTVTPHASCGGTMDLAWDSYPGALNFKLYSYSTGLLVATLPGTSTSYSTTVTPGTWDADYYLTVVTATGESSRYAVEAWAYANPCVIDPPANVTAVPQSCGGPIRVSWATSTSGAIAYKVYKDYIFLASTTATRYDDTLADTDPHDYYVTAYSNPSDESYSSDHVSATKTANCTTPPDAPTSLIASPSCGGHTSLTWTPSPNTTGYFVYRSPPGPRIATTTSPSYLDISASGSTVSYLYNVQSYNSYGISTSTASASSLGTGTCPAPNPPTGLIASGICYNRFNLSWNASNNSAGYELWRSTLSGGTFSFITALDPSAASGYKDTAGPNSQYFYKVKAYNGAGTSTFSIESTDNTQQSTSTCANTCLRDGVFLSNGQSHIFYQKSFVSASSTCSGSRSAAQAQTYTGDGRPVTLICSSGTLFDVATGNADPASTTPPGQIQNNNPVTYPYNSCHVNPNIKEI